MNAEEKNSYLKELALNLQHAGFTVGPETDGFLPVKLDDQHFCLASGSGSVRYWKEDVASEDRSEALDRVTSIAEITAEYMSQLATAPLLTANGLSGDGRFEVPNHLRPYLDYESVGREYRLEHDGVFLKDGYAGVQADVIKQEENIFQLKLATSQSSLILCLPVSDERLEKAKAVLDVEDFAQANIIDAQCSIFYLEMVLPLDNVTVEDANTLAQCVLEMAKENDGIMKYCAALQVETPSTFSEAVSIAMEESAGMMSLLFAVYMTAAVGLCIWLEAR